MKLDTPVQASALASFIHGKLIGEDVEITGINEIHKVSAGDLTYADHPKFYDRALNSPGIVVLLDREPEDAKGKTLIIQEDTFVAFNRLLRHYRPYQPMSDRIHPSAQIGVDTVLEPGVTIGENVVLGKQCLIHANVVIYDNTVIGDRVQIHANTVIGSHAFYFKTHNPRRYDKLNSSGRVVIGDDVEIGANCTVDKGGTGDTVIGRGTKIDNLVHIGHGVEIGEDCLFAAQVGVAGKTIIGNRVQLWGQVGVSKTLTIGDEAVVYAQSGVKDSLPGHATYMGSPARPARPYMRELAAIRKLPEIWKIVRDKF